MRLYREYQLKFYLNAQHYIIINGKAGDIHPHTWEFLICIRIVRNNFVPFDKFEHVINQFLDQYQNKLVNDVSPFNEIIPTLENMTEYFSEKFREIIGDEGGELIRIEASETPARSYILDLTDSKIGNLGKEEGMLSNLIDTVLDDIMARKN